MMITQTEDEAVAENEVVLVDKEPQFRLGELFRSRKEAGVAGLPVLSVTMNDGLVPAIRSTERPMESSRRMSTC